MTWLLALIALAYTYFFPQRAPFVILVILAVTFGSAAFEAVGMALANR